MIERLHLEILRTIDEHGTLTKAAERLHLSQSALSHGIKKLEQRLGTELWLKQGRRIRLTGAGQQMLKLAHRVLPQLEHSEQLLSQFAAGQRGSLRIGMECHPCYRWLLKTVSPFLQQWPLVDVDVKQAFQFGGLGALLNFDIDMLITPDPVLKPELEYKPVYGYEVVLVVPSQHRLAAKEHIIANDLSHEVLITYPVEKERLDIFSQFLLPAQSSPKQHKTLESTDIILEMVAAGRGVTALPAWLVDEYLGTLEIESIPLGPKGVHKHIYMGIRKEDRNIDYFNSFFDIAEQTTAH